MLLEKKMQISKAPELIALLSTLSIFTVSYFMPNHQPYSDSLFTVLLKILPTHGFIYR
jgi:hypothetical protein